MTRHIGCVTAKQSAPTRTRRPLKRDRLIGQKPTLKLRGISAIRTRFQLTDRLCNLAGFDVAIGSRARGTPPTIVQTMAVPAQVMRSSTPRRPS
jgi:hypothetical protein